MPLGERANIVLEDLLTQYAIGEPDPFPNRSGATREREPIFCYMTQRIQRKLQPTTTQKFSVIGFY